MRAALNGFGSAPVALSAMLGWRHVLGALNPDPTQAFASAPATPFTVYGAPLARNALALELGADWRVDKAASLGLAYSGQIGGGTNDNAVKGKFEVTV